MRFIRFALIILAAPLTCLSCAQETTLSTASDFKITLTFEGMVTFARHLTSDPKFVEVYFPSDRKARTVPHGASSHQVDAHIPALLFDPRDLNREKSTWPYHTRADGLGFVTLEEWIALDFERKKDDEPDFDEVEYLGKLSEALPSTKRKNQCGADIASSDPRLCQRNCSARLRLDVGQFDDGELLKDSAGNKLTVTFTDNAKYTKWMAETVVSVLTAQATRPFTICEKTYEGYMKAGGPAQRMEFLRTCPAEEQKLVFNKKNIRVTLLNAPYRTILGEEPRTPGGNNIAYHYDLHYDLTSVEPGKRRFPRPHPERIRIDEKICPPAEIE